MTYQSGEPSYVPPQDPWADTSGGASAPTEPLPAPDLSVSPSHFTPGVASPSTPSTWQTVAPGDGTSPEGRSRAGLYVLIVLLMVVFGGAGGFASWWVTRRYAGPIVDALGTRTPTTSPEPSPTPEEADEFRYDPSLVEVGTCLLNRGTPTKPDMWVVPCDREGSYTVLKVVRGEQIPEDENDAFTQATAEELCDDVIWDAWFGWNTRPNSLDHFYCLKRNRAV